MSAWEQREDENSQWYRRFWAWLHHPRRSLLDIYRQERSEKAGKGLTIRAVPASWNTAKARWRWDDRAKAWDKHQYELSLAAVEESRALLRKSAVEAVRVLVALLESENEDQRRLVANSILNRVGVVWEGVEPSEDGMHAITIVEIRSQGSD